MARDESIEVSVVYALPNEQVVVPLQVPAGTTALEALQRCGLLEQFPELRSSTPELAVFSRLVNADQRLKPGDRVEIVRPLKRDPRETRRELASLGRTMGRGGRRGPSEPC